MNISREARERYHNSIAFLIKHVDQSSFGLGDEATFKKIVDDHEWDGLSCACGGGWLVGHLQGCPEAESGNT